jgi:predicted nucleotide-binding protein
MNIEQAKELLIGAGHEITSEVRLPNDVGTQLRLNCGAVVNIYDKGTYYVQGKEAAIIKALLEGKSPTLAVSAQNDKVFVVYGHNTEARNQMENLLRRWNLEPIFLDQLPSEGLTLIEKLLSYTKSVNFGVVLATADDEGQRRGHTDEKAVRARQNVVLELGMLLAMLGRNRVAILLEQVENMERPSDIQGLIYIPFKDNLVKEAGLLLAKEMVAQGYKIDIKNL